MDIFYRGNGSSRRNTVAAGYTTNVSMFGKDGIFLVEWSDRCILVHVCRWPKALAAMFFPGSWPLPFPACMHCTVMGS